MNTEQLAQEHNKLNLNELTKVEVASDGSCLYRAIHVSINPDENKYLELTNKLSVLRNR